MPGIVILLSTPRNRTTVFEKSIEQLGCFDIRHEPFFDLCYDDKIEELGPLLESMVEESKDKLIFVKDFAFFMFDLMQEKRELIQSANIKFTFLIREPFDAILSLSKLKQDDFKFSAEEMMRYDRLWDCYELYRCLINEEPLIINSTNLIKYPEQVMRLYCDHIGVEFKPEMLVWSANEIPERLRDHQEWYQTAISSRGFESQTVGVLDEYLDSLPSEEQARIQTLASEQDVFYEKLNCLSTQIRPRAPARVGLSYGAAGSGSCVVKDQTVCLEMRVGMGNQ